MKEFKSEKKLNKILIGAILGTTLLGAAGAAMTPKGKSTIGKLKDFFKGGMKELKKTAGQKAMKKAKQWTKEDDDDQNDEE